MGGRGDEPLLRNNLSGFLSLLGSGFSITVAVATGIVIGCFFAILFSGGLFLSSSSSSSSSVHQVDSKANLQQVFASPCESPERLNLLRSHFAAASEENAKLKREIIELTQMLQSAEQGRDQTQGEVFVMGNKQQKAGPFGTVKGPSINPTVTPNESVNPSLAKILEEVDSKRQREVIVALANSKVKDTLKFWFTNIKRVGIFNYLVIALDKEIAQFCKQNGVPVYERNPDEEVDSIARGRGNHAISGLKFRILREFLQLGYGVLLSDIDVVVLQNPFDHLYRDSDVEAMSDGHDNMTAYGYDHAYDEPPMGWSRYALTMRIWAYNSGFFYLRPTIPSIDLLDRVAARLSREPETWEQTVFNEELFYPSHPGYDGLYASRRTLDFYLFMNSKVLFKTVRKNSMFSKLKPVIIRMNYHPDKLPRMKAAVEYYVNGKLDALKSFPNGSD